MEIFCPFRNLLDLLEHKNTQKISRQIFFSWTWPLVLTLMVPLTHEYVFHFSTFIDDEFELQECVADFVHLTAWCRHWNI